VIHLDHLSFQAPTQPKVPDHLLKIMGDGRALFGGHILTASPPLPSGAPRRTRRQRKSLNGCAYARRVNIIAVIEAVPDNNAGQHAPEVRELSVEAASYEEGVTKLRTQLPEGWRIMNLRRHSL
jgi:hypothetical protein